MAKNLTPIPIGKNVYTFQKSLADKINADGGRKTQHKRFCFVCYDENELSTFLQNTHPYSFAWIKHDKDLKDDGTPKEVHWHCVVKYDNGITVVAFEKVFSGNVFIEVPYDDDACVAYLTHKGKDKKYQYDYADVVSFTEEGKKSFFVSKEEYRENKNEEFLTDLVNRLPRRQMALKYGRDYMRNVERYERFVGYIERDKIQDAYATLVSRLMCTGDDVAVVAGDVALALEYCAKHKIIHVDRFFDAVLMFNNNRKHIPTEYRLIDLHDNSGWIDPDWDGSWANMELELDRQREHAIELTEKLAEGLKKERGKK